MKRKKLLTLLLGCTMLCSAFFMGCGTDNADTADNGDRTTLRLVYPSALTSIDVLDGGGATVLKEISQVVETLVNVDSEFQLSPSLAESWERTGDTTWQFKLRKGITYHDGTTMNADSVKWCLDRSAKENTGFTGTTGIESVDVIDEYTIQINTAEPSGEVPEALTNVVAAIIAPSSVNENGDFVQPVGTGYFQYKDFDVSTGKFTAVVYDNYWGGAQDSKIDTREVTAIADSSTRSLAVQNGEVDIVTDIPFSDLQKLQSNDDLNVLQFNTARTYFYTYNTKKEYLADKAVRQALIYAINKDEVVSDVLLGVGGVPNGIFMDDVPWNNTDVELYKYDPKKASAMLKEAGFEDIDNDGLLEYRGEDVSLNIVTGSRRPGNPLIAQATQGYFSELGLDTTVEVLEGTAYSDAIENGNYDLCLSSAATGYVPSASYYLNQYYHSDSNNMKQAGFSDPALDALIEKCRNLESGEEKYEVSREAQALAQEDAVVYTVALYGAVFAMDADITGFDYSAAVHDFIVPYSTDFK